MSRSKNTAIIILAAGNSTRLGRPKQLLKFQETTLLQRAVQAALDTCQHVVVVLGAYNKEILQEDFLASTKALINPNWQYGMGSSIKAGLKELLIDIPPEQLILMLCDQPFVDGQLLTRLISTQQETGKAIVSCSYKSTVGVPVLFTSKFFPLLLEMADSEGAKQILRHFQEEQAFVPFEQGSIDIDTAEDYNNLIRRE